MKKIIIRWAVYIVVFVGALISFSLIFNQGTTDMTVDMSEATLPTIHVVYDNLKINEMHGYSDKMEVNTIRDSITPIFDDRKVSLEIEKYNAVVSKISYEVRNADGNRLIENTDVVDYGDYKEYISCNIALKDLIEPETEYNLIIILKLSDGRDVYYYTRIAQNANVALKEKVEFVTDFSDKTFDVGAMKELSTYMEPNSEGNNESFGRVTIHSSVKQLTWGDLAPKRESEPEVTIKEIGDTMASIEFKYMVSAVNGNEKSYYNIVEYFRIRKTQQRFYLLSYDRSMDRIFLMNKKSFVNDKIILGIQKDDVQMKESEGGEIVAFVNDGRLYSYNVEENKVARLFAFYDEPFDDKRHRYDQCNVKILDVEENGNIAFLVYGYMNRGIHEGEVGVELCYYSNPVNTIEEQVFIPYTKSPKILKCDIEKLSYLNKRGNLLVFIDGAIYKISVASLDYEIVADSIDEDSFCVSASGRTIMWQDMGESENSVTTNLTVMDLASENITMTGKNSSEYIRPIGFMAEDLIYGVCDENDMTENILGDVTFPMNKVVIQSEQGNILKEYEEENIYVTEGEIADNQITLKRVMLNPDTGTYSEISDDNITSNADVEEGTNAIADVSIDIFEKIEQIALKKEVDVKGLKTLTPKEVLYEGGRSVPIKVKETKNRFFVYGNGEITAVFDNPAKAALCAYDIRGTVVDTLGNEIYSRGETVPRNQIMSITEESTTDTKNSLAICLDTMLKQLGISRNTETMLNRGDTAYDVLKNNLNSIYVLNLTGCKMDMMLYYVNQDIPVLSVLNDGSAVLIIGFNEQNIVLMDPNSGTIYKMGMNDARQMFEENFNRFMTYAHIHES